MDLEVRENKEKRGIIINLLTVTDVSKMLHIGKTNAYKLFNRKDFPKVTIGKKMLIKEDDLENYIDKYMKGTIKLWLYLFIITNIFNAVKISTPILP